MAEGEQDKSEQATPFKLKKAREKGQVARGTDLGYFAGLIAMLGCFWMSGGSLARTVAAAARDAILNGAALGDGASAIFPMAAPLFGADLFPLLTVIGVVFAVSLLFEILQTGIVFSAQPLAPDFSRLNPAAGFKRLFTLRLLLETLKNILKISLYGTVGYLVIDRSLRAGIGAMRDAATLTALIGDAALRLVAAFAGVALFFAVIDQVIARRDFLKKMGMSRREVRRETRDREGDPRLKQRRKQLHVEFSRSSQSRRNLKGADVLITNPEHIALALRYDRHMMPAPMVVSLGVDRQALHLKRLAFLHGVPIVENRQLARALYRRSALNRPIPEHCFQAVADIYNEIRRRAQREVG